MLLRVKSYPDLSFRTDDLSDIEREIGSLFGNVFRRPDSHPTLNVSENEAGYLITAELPGVSKEDVNISLKNGELTISGERPKRELPTDGRWIRNEISTGKFIRSLTLPDEVDADQISAELTDGLLQIHLPRMEKAQPREISIH